MSYLMFIEPKAKARARRRYLAQLDDANPWDSIERAVIEATSKFDIIQARDRIQAILDEDDAR